MKKISIVVSMFLLLSIMIAGVCNVNATEPPIVYEFGKWNGTGSASITIVGDHTKFSHLSCYLEEVDLSNYTVTGEGGNTIITLKEEYLKKLTNGEYSFYASFYYGDLINFSFNLEDIGAEGEIVNNAIIMGFNKILVKVTYGDEEVDSSYYNLTKDKYDCSVITFDKEYLETLSGESSFHAYFIYEYADVIKLNVDVQTDLSDTTTDIETSDTTKVNETTQTSAQDKDTSQTSGQDNVNPKTGDHEVTIWLTAMLLSAAGFCGTQTYIKNRKND